MNEPDSPPLRAVRQPDDQDVPGGFAFDFSNPDSRLAPFYFRASDVLATLLVVVIFFFFNITPLAHSDIWVHLKIGEWIVQQRQLPEHELFSPNSDPTLPASNFQWLAQIVSFATFRTGEWLAGGSPLQQAAGGVDMLRSLHGLCQAAKAAFLLLAFRRCTGSMPLAIVGVLVVFSFSLVPSSVQRPQVFAEVLFAALLWILSRPLTAAAFPESLSWRRTFGIIAVLTLWANVHGSFVIGIALTGLFWLGGVIESVHNRGFAATLTDAPRHRLLVGLFVGIIALSLLNPHGMRSIPDVFAFANSPNLKAMQEWMPMEFSYGAGGHWGYLVLLLAITITQAISPNVYGPTQLLLIAVFGFGPLLQERIITWWYMLVPVVVLPAWADLAPRQVAPRWTSVRSLRKTIIAGGIVLVGVVWSNTFQMVTGNTPLPMSVSTSPATLWPITLDVLHGQKASAEGDEKLLSANPLAAALRTEFKKYPDGRFRGAIFTPENMGDYLVWSLPPPAPVMVYSHVHAFPPSRWEDYVEVLFGGPGWKGVLEREHVNLVVCHSNQGQKLFQKLIDDPEWTIILDQAVETTGRSDGLFAALRKTPLGSAKDK